MSIQTELSREGVYHVTFGSEKQNSLPGDTLSSLTQEILAAGANPDIRVIVLKSQGDRTYCAGASFDELMSIQNEEEGLRFFSGFANVINAIRTCGKIVIGRIQGKAVGGGVGIASACDVTYATKYAAVRLSELAIGIGPFVIGPAVERRVGVSAFTELALDATTWKNAYWAKEKGLYAEVYDDVQSMDEKIEELSLKLAKSNPAALKQLKAVFWEGTDHWDNLLKVRAAQSGKLVLSDFTSEAIASFKNKS